MGVKDWTTYRRADGVTIDGEYSWVADIEFFGSYYHPVEVVEEVWELKSARTFWYLPTPPDYCGIEDEEPCENDAVAWERSSDGVWLQVCEKHREVSTATDQPKDNTVGPENTSA